MPGMVALDSPSATGHTGPPECESISAPRAARESQSGAAPAVPPPSVALRNAGSTPAVRLRRSRRFVPESSGGSSVYGSRLLRALVGRDGLLAPGVRTKPVGVCRRVAPLPEPAASFPPAVAAAHFQPATSPLAASVEQSLPLACPPTRLTRPSGGTSTFLTTESRR